MPIPMAAIERVAKKAGVVRISGKAVKEIQRVLDSVSLELSVEAATAARHAKRKTIMKDDVKIASGKA